MKFHRFLLVLTVQLGALLGAQAQRVLLHQEVAEDTVRQGTGPNQAYFQHLYGGYALLLGGTRHPGDAVVYGTSGESFLGWRQKWRISQQMAVGTDFQLLSMRVGLRQTAAKILPNAQLHERESLAWQQLQLGGYVRLNAGRRGNSIGNYLDVGGWGGWVFGTTHTYKDINVPGTGAKTVKVAEHNLAYTQRWQYGLGARLGSGRYALVGRYRLSRLFSGAEAANWPNLPRYTMGIELSAL